MTEHLFDLGPYGGDLTSTLRSRSAIDRERIEVPVEPLAPGWRWIRNRQGVVPYTHLVKAQANTGAVIVMCGKIGTPLSNDGITEMRRCPECSIGMQLQ